VFVRSGGTWSNQQALGPGGGSVALSSDGTRALVGGGEGAALESARLFGRSGETWAQLGAKRVGRGYSGDGFGGSVALSGDGKRALIGAPGQSGEKGAAWAFEDVTFHPPEIGRCTKTPAGAGDYTRATCTEASTQGTYEWAPGVAKAKFTTTIARGLATLETVHGIKIICAGESGTGEYSGTNALAGVVFKLSGCEGAGEKCASPGAAAGEVATSTLAVVLGVESFGKTPAENKLAIDLFPASNGEPVMQFTCGGTDVSVRGSVLVRVARNHMQSSSPLVFAASKGKQQPEKFAEGPRNVLEAAFNGGAFEQMGLTLKLTQLSEEPREINSAF
jgi:FG-GAP repeat